jgi:hypothetical protein
MKDDQMMELLERQMDRASQERQAQTASFERMISGLRWELRIIVVVLVVLSAARDGFMGKVSLPGVEIDTRPAKAEIPNNSLADGDAP